MGLPGRHGGPAGRLILVLHAQLPAGLRMEGSDLHLTVEVDALLLMTGGSYSLRTPKGRNLDLNLPAGSQQGQRIRLKGQGLPAAQGMGDLVLELGARIRPVTGFRARRMAEKLRRLLEEGDSD
jgi:curved DNA-binding protein